MPRVKMSTHIDRPSPMTEATSAQCAKTSQENTTDRLPKSPNSLNGHSFRPNDTIADTIRFLCHSSGSGQSSQEVPGPATHAACLLLTAPAGPTSPLGFCPGYIARRQQLRRRAAPQVAPVEIMLVLLLPARLEDLSCLLMAQWLHPELTAALRAERVVVFRLPLHQGAAPEALPTIERLRVLPTSQGQSTAFMRLDISSSDRSRRSRRHPVRAAPSRTL